MHANESTRLPRTNKQPTSRHTTAVTPADRSGITKRPQWYVPSPGRNGPSFRGHRYEWRPTDEEYQDRPHWPCTHSIQTNTAGGNGGENRPSTLNGAIGLHERQLHQNKYCGSPWQRGMLIIPPTVPGKVRKKEVTRKLGSPDAHTLSKLIIFGEMVHFVSGCVRVREAV